MYVCMWKCCMFMYVSISLHLTLSQSYFSLGPLMDPTIAALLVVNANPVYSPNDKRGNVEASHNTASKQSSNPISAVNRSDSFPTSSLAVSSSVSPIQGLPNLRIPNLTSDCDTHVQRKNQNQNQNQNQNHTLEIESMRACFFVTSVFRCMAAIEPVLRSNCLSDVSCIFKFKLS